MGFGALGVQDFRGLGFRAVGVQDFMALGVWGQRGSGRQGLS